MRGVGGSMRGFVSSMEMMVLIAMGEECKVQVDDLAPRAVSHSVQLEWISLTVPVLILEKEVLPMDLEGPIEHATICLYPCEASW